jgi:aryl-alcohol dehydrogenase-like predicted oxidoreductase
MTSMKPTQDDTSLSMYCIDQLSQLPERVLHRFSKENFPKILDVVSKIHGVGKRHNATAGQITLAWILEQGEDFVVIPGTKSVKV